MSFRILFFLILVFFSCPLHADTNRAETKIIVAPPTSNNTNKRIENFTESLNGSRISYTPNKTILRTPNIPVSPVMAPALRILELKKAIKPKRETKNDNKSFVCKTQSDCASQEDGNFCNGTLYCEYSEGKCLVNPNTIVQCQTVDNEECIKNQCQPSTGKCSMTTLADGTTCDDDTLYTEKDQCEKGICKGSIKRGVECIETKDCEFYEDGNKCNGTLYCDVTTNKCKINPMTIVSCPQGDNQECTKNQCQPPTGKCNLTALDNGTACDDYNYSTQNDICSNGICKGKNMAQCISDSDCASYEDGNLCNGTLYCDKNKSLNGAFKCAINPATVTYYSNQYGQFNDSYDNDDTDCKKMICDPSTGKYIEVNVPIGTSCDDKDDATYGDFCSGGICEHIGKAVCSTQEDCNKFDDKNPCTGTLYCNKKDPDPQKWSCDINPASLITCPSVNDNDCEKNLCQPDTGKCAMQAIKDGTSCANADSLGYDGVCKNGTCEEKMPACYKDEECAKLDDPNNKCGGMHICRKESIDLKPLPSSEWYCAINPATIPYCMQFIDNPNDCKKWDCNPKDGQCALKTEEDGYECNNGNGTADNPFIKDYCIKGECLDGGATN
ncbi:MAG: hypothetical protein ACD_73C00192G0002 [uncultured bacterium]|nr:MAG: hypothetical protein ACD_73C00192G0002 [uncultured bacterium]